MITELAYLFLGTGLGVILGWIAPPARARHRPAPGTTVAEIRARLDRETATGHFLAT
ncbi:hypothetical protein VMT65_18430 [Nocardia sp. CDC153]|uniref:hypothetical protein n=1 Tax=Nocardia sp. CDC153 TaxID=3112167 RepID=UPI002DB6FA35|nr:hypothetical protein [Nocardia sp. CDC153]MEC3955024.1 hypothetical protein [Nocardia sp. CDC153]